MQRSGWLCGIVIIACVGLSLTLRLALKPWIGETPPFITLFPAVMIAAWLGGARTGAITTLLGAGLIGWFVVPRVHSFDAQTRGEMIARGIFVFLGFMISALCGLVHHALKRTREARREGALDFQKISDLSPDFVWSTQADGTTASSTSAGSTTPGWPPPPSSRTGSPTRIPRMQTACLKPWPARAPGGNLTRSSIVCGAPPARIAGFWSMRSRAGVKDGQFAGFVGSGTDITSSHREREELLFIDQLHEATGSKPCPASNLVIQTEGFVRVLREGEPRHVEQVDDAYLQGAASGPAHLDYLRSAGPGFLLGRGLACERSRHRRAVLRHGGLETRAGKRPLHLALKIAGIAAFALENARLYQGMQHALTSEEQARRDREHSERRLRVRGYGRRPDRTALAHRRA